jgi:hypothetical protein
MIQLAPRYGIPARPVDGFNLVDLDTKIAKSTPDDFLEPVMDMYSHFPLCALGECHTLGL